MQGFKTFTLFLLLFQVNPIFPNDKRSDEANGRRDKSLLALKLKVSINRGFKKDLENVQTETYKYYHTEFTKNLKGIFESMPGFSRIFIYEFSGQEQTEVIFNLLLIGTLNLTKSQQNFYTCVERFKNATFDQEKIDADDTSMHYEFSKAAFAQAKNDGSNVCSNGYACIYQNETGSCKPLCDLIICRDQGGCLYDDARNEPTCRCPNDAVSGESNGNCNTGSSTVVGAIVGGSVGGGIGVISIVLTVFWCIRRHAEEDMNDAGNNQTGPSVNIYCCVGCCSKVKGDGNNVHNLAKPDDERSKTSRNSNAQEVITEEQLPPPPAYSKNDPMENTSAPIALQEMNSHGTMNRSKVPSRPNPMNVIDIPDIGHTTNKDNHESSLPKTATVERMEKGLTSIEDSKESPTPYHVKIPNTGHRTTEDSRNYRERHFNSLSTLTWSDRRSTSTEPSVLSLMINFLFSRLKN